jgi:hypothetical protein
MKHAFSLKQNGRAIAKRDAHLAEPAVLPDFRGKTAASPDQLALCRYRNDSGARPGAGLRALPISAG